MKRGLLALLFTFGILSGFSQSLVTDRPDQTEASSTVGKGVLQIESGFSFMTEDFETLIESQFPTTPTRQQTIALPNTLLRIGISERLELRVMTQAELQKDFINDIETRNVFGIADLQLGFKVNILKAKEGRPEIGFLTHVVLPAGTEGISGGEYGVINKLAVTHTLTQTHTLAYNIGYDFLGFGRGDLFYSLSWGISITDKVGIFIEPYGLIENMDLAVLNADAGFTYLINNDMQIDYSFGLGINNQMNFHSFGLSLRFD